MGSCRLSKPSRSTRPLLSRSRALAGSLEVKDTKWSAEFTHTGPRSGALYAAAVMASTLRLRLNYTRSFTQDMSWGLRRLKRWRRAFVPSPSIGSFFRHIRAGQMHFDICGFLYSYWLTDYLQSATNDSTQTCEADHVARRTKAQDHDPVTS